MTGDKVLHKPESIGMTSNAGSDLNIGVKNELGKDLGKDGDGNLTEDDGEK